MDSLNNSLYELDNIPIEYAPKLKYIIHKFRTKFEVLKPSHFYLCEDAHHTIENEHSDFSLESQEKVDEEDDLSLNMKLSENTEFSDNINLNAISDIHKENENADISFSMDYDKFCILGFLRRKSN